MQNPFEQLLRPYRPGSLAGPALQSPLPLAGWSGHASQEAVIRIFDCELGDLQIIAATGSSSRRELRARSWISVVYVVWGEIVILQSGRHVCGKPGSCVLIPQFPVMWQSEAFSVVCMMLKPQRMDALMRLPFQGEHRVQGSRMAYLAMYDYTSGRGNHINAVVDLLVVNLRAVAALQNDDPNLIECLALADQLARIIAILASEAPAHDHLQELQPRLRAAGMDGTFDDLILFIQANLDKQLSLEVLENYSHYSRRALQYAFRQRLGCTASQWIRSQRLDLAYQYLQQAESTDNVSRIALRCGYHSLSLFSIDFQQRFHVKPSHLLRQARRSTG